MNLMEQKAALANAFAPVRHIIPGLCVLLLIALVSMAGGFYNLFKLPYAGDRSILFMLAATVYPGPYMFYGLFCFFLFHAWESPLITLTYYASCLMMAVAPYIALRRNLGTAGLSMPQQLDEALWENFTAALLIGFTGVGIMLLLTLGARSRRQSQDMP